MDDDRLCHAGRMILRLRRRSAPARLLAFLAVALLTLGLAAPGTAEANPHKKTEVRVLSYNMHHGVGIDDELDLQRVADEIEASGADVVGLQEVDVNWGERSGWQDQATELADLLGMRVAFGANLDEDPAPGDTERRQYGNAILSRYPIVHAENHLLTNLENPENPPEQRGLLHATIQVRGQRMNFYNTHLDHQRAVQRISQVQEILDLVEAQRHPGVLVGDLNATPETEEVRMLTEGPFTDAFGGSDGDFTFPAEDPIKRIDFLLAHDATISDAEVMSSEGSDHLPLIATVTMTRGPHGSGH